MAIIKAVLVTILIIIFTAVLTIIIVYLAIYCKDYSKAIENTIWIPQVLTYILITSYYQKKKKLHLFEDDNKIGMAKILFLNVLLISIGLHFLLKPYFIYNGFRIFSINRNKISIYSIFEILLISPIFEEAIFRFYIFKDLLKKHNFIFSIFISSLLFSLIHFETPENLFPTFILGIVCTEIYYLSNKIIYAIFLHLSYNIFQFFNFEDRIIRSLHFALKIKCFYLMIFILGLIFIFYGVKNFKSVKTISSLAS